MNSERLEGKPQIDIKTEAYDDSLVQQAKQKNG